MMKSQQYHHLSTILVRLKVNSIIIPHTHNKQSQFVFQIFKMGQLCHRQSAAYLEIRDGEYIFMSKFTL